MQRLSIFLCFLFLFCFQIGTAQVDCDPGYTLSSMDCVACVPGTAKATTGNGPCEACPAGRFSSDPASAVCQDCPTGTFQPDAGAVECLFCEKGKFQDEKGQTTCKTCPPGTTTLTEGSIVCIPVIPTVDQWSLMILAMVLASLGLVILGKRWTSAETEG